MCDHSFYNIRKLVQRKPDLTGFSWNICSVVLIANLLGLSCYFLNFPSVSRSVMPDSATPWTAAHLTPPFMRFSRQGYWSGLPFTSPGDLPNPGIEPGSSCTADRFFTDWATKTTTLTPTWNDEIGRGLQSGWTGPLMSSAGLQADPCKQPWESFLISSTFECTVSAFSTLEVLLSLHWHHPLRVMRSWGSTSMIAGYQRVCSMSQKPGDRPLLILEGNYNDKEISIWLVGKYLVF